MRIQHNITAMNAYRNYSNNTSAINKNLEKLSSGYKINRAGDDAAGLAVSQKMRLQIAGLSQAQKNAKSGISLVQTAEGALQEVHEMLERMYTIAEQSANGTYDASTDRSQLQKELESLQNEITRIGKTANFNGIGIFKQYAGSGTPGKIESVDGVAQTAGAAEVPGTEASFTVNLAGAAVTGAKENDTYSITIGGQEVESDGVASDGDLDDAGIAALFDGKTWTDAGSNAYVASVSDTTITFTMATKADVTAPAADTAITLAKKTGTTEVTTAPTAAKVATATNGVAHADAGSPSGGTLAKLEVDFTGKTGADVIGWKLDIAGKKLQFVKTGDAETAVDAGYTKVNVAEDATAQQIAEALNTAVGTVTNFTASATSGVYKLEQTTITAAGGTPPATPTAEFSAVGGSSDIWFAIGAEPTASNKLTLGKMSLELGDISITANEDAAAEAGGVTSKVSKITGKIDAIQIDDQDKAWAALDKIKTATNAVSDMRGSLGAVQNRLDHTIKNLSVMQENMQDAESVIRDTDVAEEMMAYTKNNILVQSAQAMLAQANQLPQGVLQLLG